MPNGGGLDLKSLNESAPVRSTSSSYPSEAGGARSPELTVSPPTTMGRRILSTLEAYGFASAHFSLLQSSNASEAKEPDMLAGAGDAAELCPVDEAKVEAKPQLDYTSIGDDLAIHLDNTDREDEATMDLAGPDTLRRYVVTDSDELGLRVITNEADVNLSTTCLPRVSTNQNRASLSADDERGRFTTSTDPSRSSFPRNAVLGLRHGISNLHLRPDKVKKWFVSQFRAIKKEPRVIVKRMREWKGSLRLNRTRRHNTHNADNAGREWETKECTR